jgi:signal transduction histidine kinase
MPGTLEMFGLKDALEELCIKTRRTNTKCKIKLKIPIVFPRVTKELEVAVYRIIQELLNNALKHAACKLIEIKLQITGNNQLTLYFADDGKGFNMKKLAAKKGMGLGNINTRVHAFGGTVNMKSQPGEGTVYDIIIPLRP